MVKKIALFFAYSLFFFLALIYFMPKINLYYFLETELRKKGVVVSGEELEDTGRALLIQNASISYKSINSVEVASVAVKMYGAYNSVYLSNITLASTAKSFMPLRVDNVKVIYSILNPLNIMAYGVGEFGEFEAKLNILDKTLHVELRPDEIMSKKYKNTLSNFIKNEDGEFCYDKSF